MRHALAGLAGWLTMVALTAAPVSAAGLSAMAVDRVASEAMRLHETGRSVDALALLERGVVDCGADADGRSCRVALHVRAAYIAERQSRGEKDPEPLERRAAAFYEDVLRDDPGHGPALNNLALVYRALGELARGVAILQSGQSTNVDMASMLAVTLGDLLREQKKADEALDAYRRALREDPDDVGAAGRIVGLYRDLIPARIGELPKLLAEWSRRSTLDDVVEQGHRSIMQTTYMREESLALASLVAWVELSARRRWISPRSLGILPPAWKHPAVADLARYLATPDQPPSGNWWTRVLPTRNALAGVALAIGHERLGRGDSPGARARWATGLAFAPEYDAYQFASELKGGWIVRADLESELASLYFKYPGLDPQQREFSRLVQDLFAGKVQVIQLGDREAIQRFHTVLGLIFAQRGQWTASPSYMGAIYQLDNAIKTADGRQSERGPQPLPELKALLAEGYAAAGRPPGARATYIQAAAAYLDTDDLPKARAMLDRAKRISAAPQPAEPALEALVTSRSAIPGATTADIVSEGGVRKSAAYAWIFGASLPGVNAEFLARQRFKALADLSARAHDLGATPAATRYAAEALNSSVKDVGALIDFGDLARLRSVRNTVTAPVRLDQTRGTTPGKTWLLSVPGEASARQTAVSPEVVMAGRVIDALGADHTLLAKDAGALTIKGRQVHIDAPDDVHAREAAAKLGRVEGITSINVRTR